MHKDLINNKYSKWYNTLISFRLLNKPKCTELTEVHHILPRSIGGDDSDNNLVSLTVREHFVAHLLLAKMLTGSSGAKMARALAFMSGDNYGKHRAFNSKKYSLAKSIAKKQLKKIANEHNEILALQKSALNGYVDFEKLKDSNTRGLCKVCRVEPRAINYIKNGRTYYRSKCESCNSGKAPKTPRWVFEGYEKKDHCEECGFKAKFNAQLTVRDTGTQYKTVCLNCQVGLSLLPRPTAKLKPDL